AGISLESQLVATSGQSRNARVRACHHPKLRAADIGPQVAGVGLEGHLEDAVLKRKRRHAEDGKEIGRPPSIGARRTKHRGKFGIPPSVTDWWSFPKLTSIPAHNH